MKEGKAAGRVRRTGERTIHTQTRVVLATIQETTNNRNAATKHTQTQTVVSHKEPNNTSHHYYYHTESAHHLSRDIPSRNYEMVARAREMTLECSSVSPPAQPSPAWNLFRIVWL